MNRRHFFKNSSLLATGLAATKLISLIPRQALAHPLTATKSFSLTLVTNDPDQAIPHIERFLQTRSQGQKIKFIEYPLEGRQMADLVVIRNQRMVNYREARDAFSGNLRELARALHLPRPVDHAVLMRFCTEATDMQPRKIQIFSENTLVDQFPLDEDREEIAIAGARGPVVLSVKHRRAKVVATSCRHKTCMKMGSIHASGQNLVCIPNRVRIAITGQNVQGIDGVVY